MKTYKIRICGKEWTLVYKKGIKVRAQFTLKTLLIEVSLDHNIQEQRECLLHEVLEIIFVENDDRFESVYGAYLFSFFHSEFMRMVSEFSAVIQQLIKLKLL